MTAPERPEGLPEAFEWDADNRTWSAQVGIWPLYLWSRGSVWEAWVDRVGAPQSQAATPADALRQVACALRSRAAPFVTAEHALRALLGEEPEDNAPTLLRERDELRGIVDEYVAAHRECPKGATARCVRAREALLAAAKAVTP